MWPRDKKDNPTPEKNYYCPWDNDCWLYPFTQVQKDDPDFGPRTTYFARMSTAMARACSGPVYVMTYTPKKIPADNGGIWNTDEKPTLRERKKAGYVTKLVAMDLSGLDQTTYTLADDDPPRLLSSQNGTWSSSINSTANIQGSVPNEFCAPGYIFEPEGKDSFG